MWPLLCKEWQFIKPLLGRLILLGLPVFLTVLCLSAKLNSEGVVTGMTFGISFMLVYSFIFHSGYQEDKVGGLTFLRCLPVSCTKIVGIKFLVIIILGTAALLIAFLILYTLGLAGIIPVPKPDNFWINGLSSLASVLIVGSVILWTFFRLGYSKMGWAMAIIFLLLPFLIGAIGFLTLKAFPGIYTVFSEPDFVTVMLLVAGAFLAACLFDSVRALRDRDLT